MQSISPFLRWPMTDITGGLVSHQLLGRCSKQEMDLMDCLESYGLHRGMRKCKLYIDDFSECQTLKKQFLRFLKLSVDGKSDHLIKCFKTIFDLKTQRSKKYQFLGFYNNSVAYYNETLRTERDRQIACGNLTGDKKYVSPRVDSY